MALRAKLAGHWRVDNALDPQRLVDAALRHWLQDEFRPTVDDVLSEGSIRNRGLFDPKGIDHLIRLDRERRVDATYTIFSLICVEFWCRMFIDKPTPSAG